MNFEDKIVVIQDTMKEIVATLSVMYDDRVEYFEYKRMISSGKGDKQKSVVQNMEFTVRVNRVNVSVKVHRSINKIQVWAREDANKYFRTPTKALELKDVSDLPETIYSFLQKHSEKEA